jgi:hypothetical protein
MLSRATWAWTSPLIKRGHQSKLNLDDLSSLASAHKADYVQGLFQSKWPEGAVRSYNLVRKTLFRCFWPHFLFNALLALGRMILTFIGLVLIERFINYTSAAGSRDTAEGFHLVLVLFVSKTLEVLLLHQYNFHTQKLGMLIRSSLITVLYDKGLKLSCV